MCIIGTSKILSSWKPNANIMDNMFILAAASLHESHSSLVFIKGSQCVTTCVVAAAYGIIQNIEEWLPHKVDQIIRMGVAITEKLPDINKGSSKISPVIGTCIEFTIGNLTAKSMILGKQRCICQKDALKYQITYSLKFTPQILLIPLRQQEGLVLCYANKS